MIRAILPYLSSPTIVTKGPSMGTRMFDLKEILQVEGDVLPELSEIAEKLRLKTWN